MDVARRRTAPTILFYVFAALARASARVGWWWRCATRCTAPSRCCCTFLAWRCSSCCATPSSWRIVQIFVYGGGIMVLFLFVIMLVNLHRLPRDRRCSAGQSPLAVVLGRAAAGASSAGSSLQARLRPAARAAGGLHRPSHGQDLRQLAGRGLGALPDYLLPFEIASMFLLIAMIGAVVLGRRRR